jgi:hypothetical protein
MLCPGIMACGQAISAQGKCSIEEKAKLYVLVAGNAGIRSPPLLVFLAEIINYTEPELLLQVNLIVGNV